MDLSRELNQIGTGDIDLNMFDKTVEAIEKDLEQLKTRVHNLTQESSLTNKDFSVVLDSLETMRQEAAAALGQLPN